MKFRLLLTGAAIVFLAQTSQSMAFYWEGATNPTDPNPPVIRGQSSCGVAVQSSIVVYGSDNYGTGCVDKFPDQTIAEFWAIKDPVYGYLGARPGVASLRCEAGESASDFGCIKSSPRREQRICHGDPIDVLTGDLQEHAIDYEGAGAWPLKIERYYSRSGRAENQFFANSLIGRGWTTNFESRMYGFSDYRKQIMMPDGRTYYFIKNVYTGVFQSAHFDGTTLNFVVDTRQVSEKLVYLSATSTYEFTLSDGTVYVYAANGLLTQIRRVGGYTQNFTYDDVRLTSVTDSLGHVVTFVHGMEENRRYVTAIKVDGTTVVEYGYLPALKATDFGSAFPSGVPNSLLYGEVLLNSVTYPTAPTESLTYGYTDANHPYALTSITDAKGAAYASWTYDSTGRATSSRRPGGVELTSIAYDDANKRVTVTNALGKQSQINYTDTAQGSRLQTTVQGIASANCAASNLSYEYDSNEFPSRTTDPEGRITTFVNNSLGLPTTITRGYGTASAETVDLTWDTTLRKPLTMVRPALTTTYVWNPSGTLASVTQTDTTSQSVPYATNGQTRTWAYTYDTRGLVTAVDGPLAGTSDTTTYVYTTAGNLETVTDPAGLVTTFTAWNSRGQPTSMTDPNGTVVAFEYDGMGRLKTVSQDVGNTPLVWSITYDVVGNVTRIDEPSGSFRLYAWDDARRLTSVTDPTGGKMALARNDLGNITEVKISTDTAGTDVTYRDTRTYDELGRLMRLVTGTNRTWAQTWDRSDLPITVTDPRANTTTNTFDAVARLLSVRHEDNGVETVAYDTNGRVSSYTDPGTKATTWVRNGFGDIIKETSPDRGATVYEYDARGLVTKKTDARGVVANYAYDVAGRLVSKTYPASTAENVTITWDSVASGNKGKGHPTSIADRSGTTAWTWDAKGRITTEVRTIGSIAHTTSYLWNAQGRLGRVTYPSGHFVDYGYNTDGRILSIQMGAPGIDPISGVWGTTYLPFGGLSGIGYGNGLAWHATFDQAYGIDRIEVISYPDTSGPTVFDRLHPHSDGMNITALDDQQDNTRDATFGYDAANRVNSATTTEAGVQQTWGWVWDQTGNRLTETQTPDGGATTTRTYAYVSGTNRLSTVTEGATTLRAFTYDAAGNPTRDTRSGVDTDYTYDDAGRLRTVTVAGSPKATYTYDGLERLAIRTLTNQTPSGTTHFIHMLGGGSAFDELAPGLGEQFGGLGNRIIGETDGAGNLVREYVWLDDLIIAVVSDANTASPQIWWVTNDHLGRPVQMTDWSKTVVWRANHRPFGEVTAVTGTASLDARFPGQWFQLESGLSYNWHRHYDASIGRYTQPDPLGVKAGPSVYGYAGGNPVMKMDLSGLFTVVVINENGPGHAGIVIVRGGNTFVYDPGGSYNPGQCFCKSSSDTMQSDPYLRIPMSLRDYMDYQKTDGPNVWSKMFLTSAAEEAAIMDSAQGRSPFFCATGVAEALKSVPRFRSLNEGDWTGYWLPGGLRRRLEPIPSE